MPFFLPLPALSCEAVHGEDFAPIQLLRGSGGRRGSEKVGLADGETSDWDAATDLSAEPDVGREGVFSLDCL